MKRLVVLLRAVFLPLLALAGLALLAWGAAGWWLFYRELFVEELATIERLAGDEGQVTYRRMGSTNPRTYDAEEQNAEPIPWSVPFVGRIEFAEVFDHAGSPGDRKHLALGSIPVRGLAVRPPGNQHGAAVSWRTETELPLSRPLPALPQPRLEPADLLAPWPTGEPLPEEELRDIAPRIAYALAAKPSSRSRIERTASTLLDEPGRESWTLRIDDGERRFEFDSEGFGVWSDYGEAWWSHVLLQSSEAIVAFYDDAGETMHTVAVDRGLPEAKLHFPDERRDAAFAGDRTEGLQLWDYSFDRAVEDVRDRAGRFWRADENRLLVEFGPFPAYEGDDSEIRLRAIVREDLDGAIERWELRRTYEMRTFVVSHLLRLERGKDETIVAERLSGRSVLEGVADPWTPLPEPPEEAARSLRVVAYDRDFGEALFDPRSYLPDWPERPELSLVRPYRIRLLAGATLLLATTGGWLLSRMRRRTPSAASRSSAARRPRFAFRFGFATLLAVALLAISLAGWIKAYIDEARSQVALLAELAEDGGRYEIERRPPGFPWMFFATDALPLDAPPARILFYDDPAPEALAKMFATWPQVEYACGPWRGSARDRFEEPTLDRNVEALGGNVPARGDPAFQSLSFPLPTGEPIAGEELDRVVDSAIAAWRAAGADRPIRYLVRQTIDGDVEDDRLTVRDGKRWRIGDSDPEDTVEWLEVCDGRTRRRFTRDIDPPEWEERVGWRLAVQRPAKADERPTSASILPSAEDEWTYFDAAQAGFAEDDIDKPTWLPMAEAGLPRAPYCLPPCIGRVWAPPLDELLYELDPAQVVAAQRIDADRVRFDLRVPFDDSAGEPSEERPQVESWSIVALSNRDWIVERCAYADEIVRILPDDVEWSANGYDAAWTDRAVRCRREILVRTTVATEAEGATSVDSAFACEEHWGERGTQRVRADVRYAVVRSPEFAGPVFDRPTVDSLDPPAPKGENRMPWPLATATLGAAMLIGGPLVRRWRRIRTKGPNNAGARDLNDSVETPP